jgi:hypothetical protein
MRGGLRYGLCATDQGFGKLVTIAVFQDRGPPGHLIQQINQQKKNSTGCDVVVCPKSRDPDKNCHSKDQSWLSK